MLCAQNIFVRAYRNYNTGAAESTDCNGQRYRWVVSTSAVGGDDLMTYGTVQLSGSSTFFYSGTLK